MAFWEWMMRGGQDIPTLRGDPKFRGYYAYYAREVFKATDCGEGGPIWTFDRYGATRTELPDGRVVCVGGEHEDFYDEDFYIYNDVVVFTPSNQVEIYGYPADVFPPTDFHAATLVEDQLLIIGSLGYLNARHIGETPVYRIDLSNYKISKVQTSGEAPGWIHNHAADVGPSGTVTVRGGLIVRELNGKQVFQRNFDDYTLDINSGEWRRAIERKWHQFNIRRADGRLFILERQPKIEELLPDGSQIIGEWSFNPKFSRIDAGTVPIAMTVGTRDIEIIIQGDLPDTALSELIERFRAKTEDVIRRLCMVERIG